LSRYFTARGLSDEGGSWSDERAARETVRAAKTISTIEEWMRAGMISDELLDAIGGMTWVRGARARLNRGDDPFQLAEEAASRRRYIFDALNPSVILGSATGGGSGKVIVAALVGIGVAAVVTALAWQSGRQRRSS
jgi:hypothetical protein